ncbi:hypothetical protein DS2_06361 [Catenovulum agarivorans DS-2]|uniref:DUF4097 domain-containing protein n=1 Tax=Catenovulum agarivorans DS-2 TaxID=1328313 RepID=W7QPH3_9ALTE|nr:DUF4097 family beta strand repeat-containing protein [Catenovulum agarivorans]EWH10892.1 hypothetical protein DS2_06361 [Catenovulum agarivorans DS-2]
MNKLTYSLSATAIIATLVSGVNANSSQPHINEQSLQLSDFKTLKLKTFHSNVVVSHTSDTDSHFHMQQTLLDGSSEDCLYSWEIDKSWGTAEISLQKQNNNFFSSCSVERKITIRLGKNDFNKVYISHHHGGINVDQLNYSSIEIDSHHSQFTVSEMTASTLEIDKHHAAIKIDNIVADSIYFDGSHGSTDILSITAKLLEAEVNHGSFAVKRSEIGKTNIESAHASIMIDEFIGSSFKADSAHGKVKLAAKQLDRAEIENKHGEIHFVGSSKKLKTDNSHGSTYIKQLQQDGFEISSQSRHGNINLYLPEGTQYQGKLSGDSSYSNGKADSKNKIDLSVKHGHSQIIHI